VIGNSELPRGGIVWPLLAGSLRVNRYAESLVTRSGHGSVFRFDPIVLAATLEQKELAVDCSGVQKQVGSSRHDLMAVSDSELELTVGIPSSYAQKAAQDKVMVRDVAVVMPWNAVSRRQREHARLDICAGDDDFDVFDGVVRLVRSHVLFL
jgi:hypothetical protein